MQQKKVFYHQSSLGHPHMVLGLQHSSKFQSKMMILCTSQFLVCTFVENIIQTGEKEKVFSFILREIFSNGRSPMFLWFQIFPCCEDYKQRQAGQYLHFAPNVRQTVCLRAKFQYLLFIKIKLIYVVFDLLICTEYKIIQDTVFQENVTIHPIISFIWGPHHFYIKSR